MDIIPVHEVTRHLAVTLANQSVRDHVERTRRVWPEAAVLVAFSAAFFICAAAAAHRKPVWHDEIFTILMARLPSLSMIWRAVGDGADFMPPLNTAVTHVLRDVLGDGPIVTRLPAMCGVWAASVAMFFIVRRRSNVVLGACAAMLPLSTAAFRYGVEARGYGLMLGLFAVAALAWTEAARGNNRRAYIPVLATCLAAGVWAHYYAALNFVPLALGQLARDVRVKRVDWGIWTAFAVAGVLVLPLVVLMASAFARGGRSWTLVDPAGIRQTYKFLLDPLFDVRGLARLAALVVLARLVWLTTRSATARNRIPLHEVVAAGACVLIPLAGVVLSRLGAGVFTPRYGLSVVVGAVPLLLLTAWVASRRSSAMCWIVCAWLAFGTWTSVRTAPATLAAPSPNPVAERPALGAMLHRGETVCITGGLMFLQFWYYTPPMQKARLCYLVDPAAARRIMGTDSFDIGIATLARWTAVGGWEYERFVETHPRFVVYAAGSGWLLDKLRESGVEVRETGMELGARMYDVSPRPVSSPLR
jgi:hypothetical protein